MPSPLSIGLSALLASQRALQVTGQNIANVNTPGYTRQQPVFSSSVVSSPVTSIGTGVRMEGVRGIRSSLLERRIYTQIPLGSRSQVMARSLREIETLLSGSSETNFSATLSTFFNSIRELATDPANMVNRHAVLRQGDEVVRSLGSLYRELGRIGEEIVREMESRASTANQLASEIANLNGQIKALFSPGREPNDLIDHRNTLIRELAEIIDVSIVTRDRGVVDVLADGQSLACGTRAQSLVVGKARDGSAEIRLRGGTEPLSIHGGELGGLFELRDRRLVNYKAQLDQIARGLIGQVNRVHTQGVGLDGAFTSIASKSLAAVSSGSGTPVDAPLSQVGLYFEVQEGELYIDVVNRDTTAVKQWRIAVDPEVDSLSALAAKIDACDNLSATVTEAGELAIRSASGYAFDFVGNFDTAPGAVGSSPLALSGRYSGRTNDHFTIAALGSGTVGETDGLQLEVKDAAGSTLATLDVGEGYRPGQEIEIASGVRIALATGEVVAGDSLGFDVIANSDTAGLLVALGINSFFEGHGASDFALALDLEMGASAIAASRDRQAGDNTNALQIAALHETPVLGGETMTFNDAFAALLGEAGVDTRSAIDSAANHDVIMQRLQSERDAVSGVSTDEEALNLVAYQQAYQAAARFVSVIMDLTDILLNI